ncbi:hybrid sensor histidine kinase/response regulator [Paraliomyxa miuraensis]|uniref:hybrid sensor histidine kinase/response regulator n=1 Tax=Paraliomyxa miuraensis TaxID=376150 RepID=UPI00225B8807|nr:ATP-binding protein [Paraliomyxa miuraensis]MCX4247026.1 ATP-binding protein [Paraliomyxa miuraensis]
MSDTSDGAKEAGAVDSFDDAREHVPFPLFELDERGHVSRSNLAAQRQFGTAEDHSLATLLGPATTQEVLARLDRLHREGSAPAWTTELFRDDEPPISARLCLSEHPCPPGDPWRANLSVVTVPASPTQARPPARAITQEIGRVLPDRRAAVQVLASGVAHEIGNPLTYMLMCLDELGRSLDPEHERPIDPQLDRLQRLLQQTRKGAERVQEIVRGLSSYSRDHGRRESVDVNRAVRAALEMARAEMPPKLRVHTSLESVPAVRANPSRLVQVLFNLLINAAQALEPIRDSDPSAALGVDTWCEGSWVYINVWDTGPGIAAEIRDHIFEPFVSSKPAGRGAGLGLAVCHNYVAELDGEIDFDCEPEQGTRFTVRLPAEVVEPRVAQPAPPPERPPPEATRLLVVDDEPEIRRGLQAMLSRFGRVDVAESAADARTLLTAGVRYDLVLCDLVMPGESGEELYAWITTTCPDMAGRVAYVTGGGPRLTAARSPVTAEDGPPCLLKPFRRQELYEFVRRALSRAATYAPADVA